MVEAVTEVAVVAETATEPRDGIENCKVTIWWPSFLRASGSTGVMANADQPGPRKGGLYQLADDGRLP